MTRLYAIVPPRWPPDTDAHLQESIFSGALAHRYLDGLRGLEIGGAYHNAFGLDTLNVDRYAKLDTVYKNEELMVCGKAMPVDIIAAGDEIPVSDKSFDFVVSSHVIEHFFDPIRAIKEWQRIATRYIYIIAPQRDALESDVPKPLTPVDEILKRHTGEISAPPGDPDTHFTRWTSSSFVEMCQRIGMAVVDVQDPDDKVGNGFAVVLDVSEPEPQPQALPRSRWPWSRR